MRRPHRMSFRAAAPILFIALAAPGCTTLRRLTYEGFNRDRWQKPDLVVQTLEIRPGQRVADLGAGSGYFTFRLADAVGPEGQVFAADVDKSMNEYLRAKVAEKRSANIEVIDAKYEDPLIPGEGVDLIFVCDTYHHIEDRETYFKNAAKYLRDGGRVAIIDFKQDQWVLRLLGHTMPKEEIVREMEAAGYALVADHDSLWRHYFLVFQRTCLGGRHAGAGLTPHRCLPAIRVAGRTGALVPLSRGSAGTEAGGPGGRPCGGSPAGTGLEARRTGAERR
ncbi:MAG: class I SAM-dependent methyltransferase [Planctomycetes bacterium]|nr:class I SAM-dependent methyltransferase [Planctomycetota bacterium]